MASLWDTETFVRESNRIDPQYDNAGRLLTGGAPGELMYDHHLAAYDIACYLLSSLEKTPDSVALSTHRVLTRDIDWFETRDASGKYRCCDLSYPKSAPPFWRVQSLMEEVFVPAVRLIAERTSDSGEARRNALWTHYCFECIHPHLDGNGRTGRILVNGLLHTLGEPGIVFYYEQRKAYFAKIKKFAHTVLMPIFYYGKERFPDNLLAWGEEWTLQEAEAIE